MLGRRFSLLLQELQSEFAHVCLFSLLGDPVTKMIDRIVTLPASDFITEIR